MATRPISRVTKWCAAAALSGALVVGGAGVSSATARPTVTLAAVKIQNFAFKPKALYITVNTKVTWKNYDSTGHNATFKGFHSPTLATGGTWSHKFTTVGTFKYHCTIHPTMTGKVVVTP
jgi:plastocyanin